MKVRVYDDKRASKLEGNYTLYFPVPKHLQIQFGMKAFGFAFSCNTNYCDYYQVYESLEFPNGLHGVNIGKAFRREDLPQFMQRKINDIEFAYNTAIKFNDDYYWNFFNKCLKDF